MKKISLILAFFVCLTANYAQVSAHFHTTGANLYDPCGNQITLRGMNYAAYNWGYDNNELRFREVAKTGANCVRVTWYANDANTAAIYSAANLGRMIDSCTANKMIPIIELHDQTCADNPAALTALTSFFTNVANKTVLQARQKKFIINYANEALYVNWSGNPTTALTTYRTTYSGIISTLRTAGYHCPIMIDASECGTNSDLFTSVAPQIITADPDHNVIFSAHSYWYSYAPTVANVQAKLQAMVVANIPFILGEVANQQDDTQNCQYNLDYQTVLQEAQNRNIGWLAWSWNNDVCPNRQCSSTGNFANLTPYGNVIINNATYGLKAKAVRTSYLINSFQCPVATENPAETPQEPVLYTHADSWEVFFYENTPSTIDLYDINGRLVAHYFSKNNVVTIMKPLEIGIYILVGSEGAHILYRQKVSVLQSGTP